MRTGVISLNGALMAASLSVVSVPQSSSDSSSMAGGTLRIRRSSYL